MISAANSTWELGQRWSYGSVQHALAASTTSLCLVAASALSVPGKSIEKISELARPAKEW